MVPQACFGFPKTNSIWLSCIASFGSIVSLSSRQQAMMLKVSWRFYTNCVHHAWLSFSLIAFCFSSWYRTEKLREREGRRRWTWVKLVSGAFIAKAMVWIYIFISCLLPSSFLIMNIIARYPSSFVFAVRPTQNPSSKDPPIFLLPSVVSTMPLWSFSNGTSQFALQYPWERSVNTTSSRGWREFQLVCNWL